MLSTRLISAQVLYHFNAHQSNSLIKWFRRDTSSENNIRMAIDFYYFPLSPPCRSLMVLAKAIGVHFNLIVLNVLAGEHMKPDFLKVNPQHIIPTINDQGFILWESRAIMAYLVRKYARNDSLYPKEPKLKAVVDQRLYFDLDSLYSRMIAVYFPMLFGDATEPNPDRMVELENSYGVFDKYLENSEFVAGDNLTIADFTTVTTVAQTNALGFDINRFDNVASWYKRCQETMEKYGFEEQIVQKGNELAAILHNKLQN